MRQTHETRQVPRHAREHESWMASHARYLRVSRCEGVGEEHVLEFGDGVGVEELVCGRVSSEVQQFS